MTTVRIPDSLAARSIAGAVIVRPPIGRLQQHFRAEELSCPCGHCERVVVHWALVELLQRIRWRIGRPIIVTSGYRCPEHNAAVGGTPSSLHMFGMAADLQCEGLTPQMLADVATECGAGGLGLYPRHLHVDVGTKRTWKSTYPPSSS